MPSETGIISILDIEKQANKNKASGYAGLGADGVINPTLFNKQIAASANNQYGSGAANWGYRGGTYIPLLTLTLTDNYKGIMTTSFYLSSDYYMFNVYAYVAHNGIQIGTTRIVVGLTPVQFIENTLSTDWHVGDLLEIWGKSGTPYVRVNDFYLSFDIPYILIGNYKLAIT
jgi:hypothetical protein